VGDDEEALAARVAGELPHRAPEQVPPALVITSP
jgi:hypothetical protein